MRTTILFLLAASVSAPALAQSIEVRDRSEREARSERSERPARAERSERSEPREMRVERRSEPERSMRVERDAGEGRAARVERGSRDVQPVREIGDVQPRRGVQLRDGGGAEAVVRERREVQPERPRRSIAIGDTVRTPTVRDSGDGPRGVRIRDNGGSPTLVQDGEDSTTPDRLRGPRERRLERIARGGDVDGRNPPAVSRVPREGTQPPVREARRDRDRDGVRRWDGSWRHDRRYDWRRWRDRNRSRFHLGIYFDPFGWNYRRYHIGWRMWPHYYRSSFWLNDPWSYRLPYAPPGYRWIRYYDDAVLVDTWDGRVVDVIYNFFW